MIAKFGLILIVLASALLAFLAGTAAPDSVNIHLRQAWQAVRQQLPSGAASAALGSASGATAPAITTPRAGAPQGAPATASVSPPASSASSSAAASSVSLDSLLLPTLPASTATYALQAGQFASQQAAQDLAAGLSAQGVTSTVIITADDRGTAWAVVTLGRFGSADEARSQRSYLANKLGLPQYLAPITLPPPAKPPG